MIDASPQSTLRPRRVLASFAFALATLPLARIVSDPARDSVAMWFVAFLHVLAGIGLAAFCRAVRGRPSISDAVPMLCFSVPIAIGFDGWFAGLLATGVTASWLVISLGWPAISRWFRDSLPRIDQSQIGFVLLVVVYYLVHFDPPAASYLTEGLDDSWRQGLGHALARGMRFGHDIVFNQGPLGYFRESPPNLALFSAKLLWWEGAYKLAAAIVALLPLRVIRGPLIRTLYCLALLLPSSGPDGAAFVTIAAGSYFLLHRFGERSLFVDNGFDGIAARLVLVVIAVTLLVKFTYFGLAIACLGCVVLHLLAHGRIPRVFELVLVVSLVFLWTWVRCDQRIEDIPAFLRGSLAIARGYNVAMVEFGPESEVDLAIDMAIVAAALALAHLVARWRAGRTRALCDCAIVLATLLLTFKAGFTRHYGSSVLFFHAACFAPLFLAGRNTPGATSIERLLDRARPILAVLLVALGMRGFALARHLTPSEIPTLIGDAGGRMQHSFERLADWKSGRLERDNRSAMMTQLYNEPLPVMQRRVMSGSVDVFGSRQGLVFATGMHWQPRPVFQSYSAYETRLLELNANFYRGPNAPRFVLLEGDQLDQRLPTACDTLALQEVLRRYDPVEFERGFVLMQRSSSPRTIGPRETLLEGTFPFREWIDLPPIDRGCRVLHVEFEPTLAARVQRFFYHVDLPEMDVELTDGTVGQFRLVPDAMRAGALIDPLCVIPSDWQRFFTASVWPRPQRIRILPPAHAAQAFGDSVRVRMVRADDLLPLADNSISLMLSFPSFDPRPSRAETSQPPTLVRIDDLDATVVHPPAIVTFDLPKGRYHLTARIGMVEDAWRNHETDGVSYLIGIDGARQTTLLTRTIDPKRIEADRTPPPLELDFDIGDGEVLKIASTFGDRGDSSFDWAYLGPLTIRVKSDASK